MYLFNNDAPSKLKNDVVIAHQRPVRMGLGPRHCDRDSLHVSPTDFLTDWLRAGRFADVPQYAKRLSGPVLAFVSSHCGMPYRDSLVRRLLDAGFEIHSYGYCLPTEVPADVRAECRKERKEPAPASCPEKRFCPGARNDDELHCIQRRYRFCLAVENNKEPGYHTEKLYYPLMNGCIPIYGGDASVVDFVPSASAVLQIADYEDDLSKLLARIKHIDSSQELWDSYHRWRHRIPDWFSPAPFVRELVPCLVCEHALWRLGRADHVAQHRLAHCRRQNTSVWHNV